MREVRGPYGPTLDVVESDEDPRIVRPTYRRAAGGAAARHAGVAPPEAAEVAVDTVDSSTESNVD